MHNFYENSTGQSAGGTRVYHIYVYATVTRNMNCYRFLSQCKMVHYKTSQLTLDTVNITA